MLHTIGNLSNDYVGAKRGHDSDDSPRRYTVHQFGWLYVAAPALGAAVGVQL